MHFVKSLKKMAFLIAIGVFASQSFAQNEQIAVKLKSLEMIKQQEMAGDELYISVTEFPTVGSPYHYQVPAFPTHWLSKYLSNVKDVVIWKKNLNQCEPIDLLITLVEEDFEPWNMDDSLGSVQLKVQCVNGKAVEQWTIPDSKNTAKDSKDNNAFSFTGEGVNYKATFTLEDTITPKPN